MERDDLGAVTSVHHHPKKPVFSGISRSLVERPVGPSLDTTSKRVNEEE